MQEQPSAEHAWLHKLVGEWTCESTCKMGPDAPEQSFPGAETVRSLGGLWTIGEGSMGDSAECHSIMTLGYDPKQKKFVGSFVAGMMTHLWPYIGELSADQTKLELDSVGPNMMGTEGLSKYKDTIEFINNDHRVLSSKMQMPSGEWIHFMTAHYYRKK